MHKNLFFVEFFKHKKGYIALCVISYEQHKHICHDMIGIEILHLEAEVSIMIIRSLAFFEIFVHRGLATQSKGSVKLSPI